MPVIHGPTNIAGVQESTTHTHCNYYRLHSHDLQAQVTKLTNQLAESDRILANRTAELEAHLQTAAMATGGNDTKLQAQVNMLLLEKVANYVNDVT